MKLVTLRDSEGNLQPQAFLIREENIKYHKKEIKNFIKSGDVLVEVEIKEIREIIIKK